MDNILKSTQERITAYKEVAGWWEELSPEGQAEYLKEHPDSKKAMEVRDQQKKNREERPSHKALIDHEEKQKHPNMVKHQDDHPKNVDHLHDDAKKFFKNGGDKPGSKDRKEAAGFVKKHSKKIVKNFMGHMKHQVKEWKNGFVGIGKIMSGKHKKLTDKEKEDVKALIKDVVITAGVVAVSGGIAHGVIAAMHHVGRDFLAEAFFKTVVNSLKAAEHAGLFKETAAPSPEDMEKMVQAIVDFIADFAENGDIPKDAWLQAAGEEDHEEHGEPFLKTVKSKGKEMKNSAKDNDSDDKDDKE